MLVAANIKRIIREKGVKQKHVSEISGINEKLLSALLNNRKLMREEHMVAIAKALEVPINELFSRDSEEEACNDTHSGAAGAGQEGTG